MSVASANTLIEGRRIRVRGLVQGVGFRPTVWRLARECGISGEVWNDADGVMVRAWGEETALDRFLKRLEDEPPPLARIDAVEWTSSEYHSEYHLPDCDFRIAPSRDGEVHTGIVPDAATCQACLAEIADPVNRRYRYPFTNCTHCGPRLSIVRAVPYDRPSTSMAKFALCRACQAEYLDPADRRFHAQPIACPACGPHVWLERVVSGTFVPVPCAEVDAVAETARLLKRGAIIAVKGLGGFNLACDACDAEAVARLRARKRRPAKPLALMARDLDVVRRYCSLNGAEEAELKTVAAPIVILRASGREHVAAAVAPRQATLGFMLPCTPLHHLLLADFEHPLVMTSGNLSEAPQCTENDDARQSLSAIADYGLFHDRDIENRLDDSVVRVMAGAARVLRRARGYAPSTMTLPQDFDRTPPLLAMGGELKNTFALVKDRQATVSQHVGDLENAETFDDYRNALALYAKLFDHAPQALAIDVHPEYLSTKLGREWSGGPACRVEAVQHHHAHIASCLAENGVGLDTPPVLGIALDGLGYGSDGTLWGGEFLSADYRGFERLGAFPAIAMPGGARATRQPWRNCFAHIDAAIGWESCRERYSHLEFVRCLETRPLATVRAMMREQVNSPKASSCGRLFDAVAFAVGLCQDEQSYEGQAASELEALVDDDTIEQASGYPVAIRFASGLPTFDFAPLWQAVLVDLAHDTPKAVIAARFHRGLADAIVEMARWLFSTADGRISSIVALSGGSFQNRLLLEQTLEGLKKLDVTVLMHRRFPANDGGLSLGQAVVAAARSIEVQEAQRGKVKTCA